MALDRGEEGMAAEGTDTTATARPGADIAELLSRVKVHDADSHLVEPHDLWTSRMRPTWGDGIPRVRRHEDGTAGWYTGSHKLMAAAVSDDQPHPHYDDETWAGGKDPVARLRWMDAHGIHSQVLYPNLIGFFASTLMKVDPQLRLEIYQAYNDYQTEFAAVAPDRFVPLVNLPFWDVDASVVELHRGHEAGHRGVNFGWRYEQLGLPPLRDPHWEPLLKTIEEMGLSISIHIGFNGNADDDPALQFDTTNVGLERVKNGSLLFLGNAACIAELIVGRICHRYPTLRFISVESGVGYVPFLLDALDWTFQNENWHKAHPEMLLPSEYFQRQVYGTFWFERDLARVVDLYPDNFLFSSDYPHPTSLTPSPAIDVVQGPRDTIVRHLAGLPEPIVRKLVHDNAAGLYDLA